MDDNAQLPVVTSNPGVTPSNKTIPVSQGGVSGGAQGSNLPDVAAVPAVIPTPVTGNQMPEDPWTADFATPNDPAQVAAIDADIAKFDPTPQTPLTVADLYQLGWRPGEQAGQPGGQAGSLVAGKERAEVAAPVFDGERHPIVETRPVMNKEIEQSAEMGVKVEEKEHTVLSQPVKDQVTGETLVANVGDDTPQIEVPITGGVYQRGLKLSPSESLKWLVEMIRLFMMRGYKVVFRPSSGGS